MASFVACGKGRCPRAAAAWLGLSMILTGALELAIGHVSEKAEALVAADQPEVLVKVLVAKKNLENGIIIKKPEDLFEEKEILEETAPKNALTKFEQVKGRQLKIYRQMGDTISEDDLYKDSAAGIFGMRPGHPEIIHDREGSVTRPRNRIIPDRVSRMRNRNG